MRKSLIISIFLSLFLLEGLVCQVYYTNTGHVNVKSENNIKNIEADNYQILSSINMQTGIVKFEGLLKSFEFKLGAIDRVFNSQRINVNQYPKFRFEGKLIGLDGVDLNSKGQYEVEVQGTLYIWDEKRITSAKGMVETNGNGSFKASSDFLMRIEEQSMVKLNKLIDEKLPDVINISTNSIGVDRDIQVGLKADYKLRNW
jgi:hypothetical protein